MPARLNNGNADCSDTVIDPGPSHKWITTWQNPTFCNQSVCFFHISLSVINILFKLFEWYNMISIRMSFYLNRDIITLNSTKFTTNRKGYVDALLRARRRRRRSNWNFSPKLLCHHSLRLAPVFCPPLDLICPLDVIFLLVLSGGSISSVILSAPPSYHGCPQKPSSAVFVRPSLTYLPASPIIMHSDNWD